MGESAIGQRQTRQREAIVLVFDNAPGPLTVHQIHQKAATLVEGLGIATVYRAVKLLLEAGQIQTVVLPAGETRYERADLGHHHHFHCRVCDDVFDLHTCPVRVPADGTYGDGFQVEDHEVTLYGTCPSCS